MLDMILRNATIRFAGYDPDKLSKGSHKRICVSCDQCGRVRWVNFKQYRDLCNNCSKIGINKGKNNCNYKSKITLICQQCGDEFKVIPARKNSKFCSNKCRGVWRSKNIKGKNSPVWKEKIKIICKYCNKEFEVNPGCKYRKFCSQKCYGKWVSENLVGEKSHSWCGGYVRDYVLPENRCTKLNSRFKGSEMHHIMSGVVIYLPKYLHNRKYGIIHNFKSSKGMVEINEIAINYLIGDY